MVQSILTPASLTLASRNELWLLGSETEPRRLVKVYTGAGALLRRRTEMELLRVLNQIGPHQQPLGKILRHEMLHDGKM